MRRNNKMNKKKERKKYARASNWFSKCNYKSEMYMCNKLNGIRNDTILEHP